MAAEEIRVAIYARKSKETEDGDSIGNQVKMCRDYVSSRISSCIVSVYMDEGYSGKNLNRPQMQQMMAQQEVSPFNYIIVYRLDRISRSVSDFSQLAKKLEDDRTALICIKEQFDTSTPMGKAMMNIAAVFAQLERETIAERVRDNMYLLAKGGRWMGGTTPIGYQSEEHVINIGDKVRKYCILKTDSEKIGIAKHMYAKYEELRSLNALDKHLQQEGIKTQRDKDWDKTNVRRVLTNPIYCIADADSIKYFSELGCNVVVSLEDCDGKKGLMAYNRTSGEKRTPNPPEQWLITIASHEGILTGKEWIHIQRLLEENGREKFGGKANKLVPQNNYALLSGILYCQRCGKAMRPKKYPSGTTAYVCSGKANGSRCDCKNIMQEYADEEVTKKLLDDTGKGFAAKYISVMSKAVKEYDKERAKRIKILQGEKRANEAKIKNLVDTISSGNASAITMQAINTQIEQLDAANRGIDDNINDIQNKDLEYAQITQKVKQATTALRQLSEHFDELPINNRRDYIQTFIDRIEYDGECLHIFTKGSPGQVR